MKSTDVLVSHRNENPLFNVCEDASFLFPTIYIMQNTQDIVKFTLLLLAVCTVAVIAMCEYCSRVSRYSSNPRSKCLFFNHISKLLFPNLRLIAHLKCLTAVYCDTGKQSYHIPSFILSHILSTFPLELEYKRILVHMY